MPKKTSGLPTIENTTNQIIFQGVKTHNLKNIDITLPKNQIITITGVSGSGKSSLAFDTIFKEGQFRYIESLSSYLRQFFQLGERPNIDYSTGLSPAIAIEQNKRVGNARSTVGTLTEIDDYLRLLFAKLGNLYCYHCGQKIKAQTVDHILDDIKKIYTNKKIYLLEQAGAFASEEELSKFIKKNRNKVDNGKGFMRYLIMPQTTTTRPEKSSKGKGEKGKEKNNGAIEYFYLETPSVPEHFYPLSVYGIFDRVTIEEAKLPRLKEDIIKILGEAKKFGVYTIPNEDNDSEDNKDENIVRFTDKNFCATCNISYPEFSTQHFSPNRQEGACQQCHGIGEVLHVDTEKIIDTNVQYMKAILPRRDSTLGQTILTKLAQKYSMDTDAVWKVLPERFKDVVINGDNELLRVSMGGKFISITYKGIEDVLMSQYKKGVLTADFQAMFELRACPECEGAKIRKESLNVFLEVETNKEKKSSSKKVTETGTNLTRVNIFDLQKKTLEELISYVTIFAEKSGKAEELVKRICTPLINRIATIEELGLKYLTLTRQIDTLSGGEIQRLRLAKQLGNKLTGIIYVLDEPTIGLDKKEIDNVITAIKHLKAIGNTIIVVEHNEAFIKASDRVVEVGPGSGDFGGNIVFNGTYQDFIKGKTLTAQYVQGKKKIEVDFTHKPSHKTVTIKNASKHNLQNVNLSINLGSFTILTGPSGAGKTTLMYYILYKFLEEKEKFIQGFIRLELLKKGLSRQEIIAAPIMKKEDYEDFERRGLIEFYKHLGINDITGHQEIKNTIYVDQTSIGKTPRSCPATFIGVFDNIRKIFAGTNDAKFFGFTDGHFSFNSSKGACPECEGYGYKKVELQFLPDTYVHCDLCRGKRYKPEILNITRKGKNIADLLNMYIIDALDFFEDIGFIAEDLSLMCDIGLGYLRLGQPAHTLSGGESQRLKLVKHLLKSYKGHTVYFLDEPTVGLHPSDIEKLLLVLKKFLDNGDTILMIEHDQSLLQFADHVVRLENGKIV